MDRLAQMHRLGSFRVHQSLVEKPLKIEQYWPMWSDKRNTSTTVKKTWGDTPEEAMENYKRIMGREYVEPKLKK